MILYFSGTGNSKYTAQLIQGVLNDEVVSLNDVIKSEKSPVFSSETPFVIVCPTYAWRMPRVVSNLIDKADFKGNRGIYFVLTCGDSDGNAYKYAKELCKRKGLIFHGLKSVKMPENYIAMFNAPDKNEAHRIIEAAKPQILKIARRIKAGKNIGERTNAAGAVLSGPVNSIFYRFAVKADGFYADEKCISCGKCEKVCPLNNVKLVEGKPVWGKNCTHCMACICLCPTEAIEYKKKSIGKSRYHI